MPEVAAKKFDLDTLVKHLKAVAVQPDAATLIKSILRDAVVNPEWVRDGMQNFEENDTIIFEDDSVSIWHCRFDPGYTVPPHDHQVTATIAIYQGAERNDFFVDDRHGGIRKSKELELPAGNVLQIAPEEIHAVSCASNEACCGIHVYLGKLTEVNRNLFNIETNEVMRFSDENYKRLTR